MTVVVSYTTITRMMLTLADIASMSTLTSSSALIHGSDAQTEINARIGKLYSLPFTQEIPILETICTDLAIYRSITGKMTIDEESPWFLRYKESRDLLDKIVAGEMVLVTSSGEIVSQRSDDVSGQKPWSNNMNYHPTHTELPWTEHVQDEDKIDDLANERDLTTLGDRLK